MRQAPGIAMAIVMSTSISPMAVRITTARRTGLGMCIVRITRITRIARQHTDLILVTACMAAIVPAKVATGRMVAGTVQAAVVMAVTECNLCRARELAAL